MHAPNVQSRRFDFINNYYFKNLYMHQMYNRGDSIIREDTKFKRVEFKRVEDHY